MQAPEHLLQRVAACPHELRDRRRRLDQKVYADQLVAGDEQSRGPGVWHCLDAIVAVGGDLLTINQEREATASPEADLPESAIELLGRQRAKLQSLAEILVSEDRDIAQPCQRAGRKLGIARARLERLAIDMQLDVSGIGEPRGKATGRRQHVADGAAVCLPDVEDSLAPVGKRTSGEPLPLGGDVDDVGRVAIRREQLEATRPLDDKRERLPKRKALLSNVVPGAAELLAQVAAFGSGKVGERRGQRTQSGRYGFRGRPVA